MKTDFVECDTLELAQEYCDAMTAQLCGGKGPQPGNVTQVWDVPRVTKEGKYLAKKHPKKETHDKAPVKPGRRSKKISDSAIAALMEA